MLDIPLSEFGAVQPATGLAFGVDSTRPQLYSLRQARYQALAFDIQRMAAEYVHLGRPLRLLDIGVNDGICRKYLKAWPASANIDFYGADLDDHAVPEREQWKGFWIGDFMEGYPEIPSGFFDVVVCEQVLEHLSELEVAVRTLARVLRPGGTLIVGVPIFPHGCHLLRKPMVAMIDGMQVSPKQRGHVQAFSLVTFKRLLRQYTNLEINEARGFRIISGGILRPLENCRWWWQFNRWLGSKIPGACIEIQVIARKPI
ncbi:MAG: class I SAM-dependent methyltransferase [Alphaproteobacteria bacterium]|nr:class I SAM-dependent methyltransferase [Alphaproteobacteria bacterium]